MMFRLIAAGLIWLLAQSAIAQDTPWETERGRLCLEGWITAATGTMNRYDGTREFNLRKPWTINRYGLFIGRKMYSNNAPDNWAELGANRDSYMWRTYTDEAQYPVWNGENRNRARVPGLRYFVRNCLAQGGTGSASSGVSSGSPATAQGSGNDVNVGPGVTVGPGVAIGPGATSGPITSAGPITVPATATCPPDIGLLTPYPGVVLGCTCPPLETPGRVWGTGPYTSDSALCTAAIHAGMVPAAGGTIWATSGAGLASYAGSSQFGITTQNYGSYGTSLIFLNAGPGFGTAPQLSACPGTMENQSDPITCRCAPEQIGGGAVWGTGIYTNDSAVCRAALHAGVISASGGDVTIAPMADAGSYQGSSRNGVVTKDYGAWRGSFVFR